jgi:hypothetical protein
MKLLDKLATIWILAGISVGFLCGGCGKEGATKDSPGGATAPAQAAGLIKWSHKGTAFTAVTVAAKKHTLLDKSGVMVTFDNEETPPDASTVSTLKKNRVEVFFPTQNSGCGKPISVAFHKGSGTIQESNLSGYDGQITVNGNKLIGQVNINKIGFDEDCSISGSFEAALTAQ